MGDGELGVATRKAPMPKSKELTGLQKDYISKKIHHERGERTCKDHTQRLGTTLYIRLGPPTISKF